MLLKQINVCRIYKQTDFGNIPWKHFGAILPNSIWIKFTDKDYQEWVGSFERGWDGYGTFIINLDQQEKVFVVLGGKGFLIDITKRAQLNINEIADIKTAPPNYKQTIVYFSGGYNLQFIDLTGNVSVLFDNYFFDDIELIEIKDDKLYAKYGHYQRDTEPFRFEINLLTKEVKDSFNDNSIKEYPYKNPNLSLFDKLRKWINL